MLGAEQQPHLDARLGEGGRRRPAGQGATGVVRDEADAPAREIPGAFGEQPVEPGPDRPVRERVRGAFPAGAAGERERRREGPPRPAPFRGELSKGNGCYRSRSTQP